MPRSLRAAFSVLLLAIALLPSPLLTAEGPAGQTLTGTYRWDQGEEGGDLRAVFTPAGEARWGVAFHFEFKGKAHIYAGTAEGALGQGALSGRVESDQGRGVFTFKGEFKDGRFQGSHARLTGGNEEHTGTLTLGG